MLESCLKVTQRSAKRCFSLIGAGRALHGRSRATTHDFYAKPYLQTIANRVLHHKIMPIQSRRLKEKYYNFSFFSDFACVHSKKSFKVSLSIAFCTSSTNPMLDSGIYPCTMDQRCVSGTWLPDCGPALGRGEKSAICLYKYRSPALYLWRNAVTLVVALCCLASL